MEVSSHDKMLARENEELKQSNHSLQMKLTCTGQTLESCTAELEHLQELADKQRDSKNKKHTEDIELLRNKIQRLEQKDEDSYGKITELKEKLSLAQEQVKEAQEAMLNCTSFNESVDDSAFHNQIASLTCDKQNLESAVSHLESESQYCSSLLVQLQETMKQLNEDLDERECKLTSSYNEMERLKEENLELKEELEIQKLSEKDPKTKGNSLFAEVEDHRLYLEQKMLNFSSNYKTLRDHYEMEVDTVSRLRLQVQSLIGTSISRNDGEYVNHLNDCLNNYKCQIDELVLEVNDLNARIKKESDKQLIVQCVPGGCMSRSSYILNSFEATKRDLVNLKRIVQEIRFKNVAMTDQLLQLQRKVHKSETSNRELRSQCIKIRVQLEETQSQKGIYSKIPEKVRIFVEKIPDDDVSKDNGENNEQNTEKNQINGIENKENIIGGKSIKKYQSENLKSVTTTSLSSLIPARTAKTPISLDCLLSSVNDPVTTEGITNKQSPLGKSGEKISPLGESNRTHSAKGKKSVRMQETVVVHEDSGGLKSATLKSEGNSAGKLKKPLRYIKQSAPDVVVSKDIEENCIQQ